MNLSIRAKLLLGYTTILAILVALAIIMTNKLSESNTRLTNIINLSSKRISLSQELLIGVLDACRHEKNIIMEKDLVKKDYYKDRIYAAVAAIDKKIPELQDLTDDKGAKILNEFTVSWKKYQATLDEIIQLALKNENERAFELSIKEGLKVRDESLATLNRLIQKNELSMSQDKADSEKSYATSLNTIILFIALGLLIAIGIALWIIKGIEQRIVFMAGEAGKIASREYTNSKMLDTGKDELSSIFNSLISVNQSFLEITDNANSVAAGNYTDDFTPRSANDSLGNALKKMTVSLRETTAENEKHTWLTKGQNQLNESIRGDQSIEDLSANILTFLCGYTNANIGAFYTINERDNDLYLTGKFAFLSSNERGKFGLGEGLVGQAAQEQKLIHITDLKDEQVQIVSTITKTRPSSLMIAPFLFEGKTLGVVEIGKLGQFSLLEKEFFEACMESIGIGINSAIARKRIQQLLEETQVQSEELQSQQEELRQVNEELEEQAQNLKQQQEELQQTNEELEEQTQALETRNKEVEASKLQVEQKTKQLEITSKYKSEFLANMSHELRTPLNSLLILSKDLAENKKKNLSPDQVEGAEIIYKSGTDLLILINEVLDLSKIEAGKMVLNPEKINLKNFSDAIQKSFKFQTEKKGLGFSVYLAGNLPEFIISDSQRLDQILKNLLSNAIKFTEKGEIKVNIHEHSENKIAISVADTGIGIPDEKQLMVFEAFHQADGGTSRKYGGTGLGLSISRELAKILEGEIKLQSKPDEGSVFTLILPYKVHGSTVPETKTMKETEMIDRSALQESKYTNHPTIEDDRETIKAGDKIVLIVEDDLRFAEILKKQANKKDFKCIAASTGEDGLLLTEKYKPNAIILDLDLPGIDGHQVLSNLKSNPIHRHIPVHIMSVNERTLKPIKEGAVEYLTKPVNKKQLDEAFNRIGNLVDRKMKNLLIIEDDDISRTVIKRLIGNGDVKSFEASSGAEAIDICSTNHIDCIVLDIGLPDISGFEFIHKLNDLKEGRIPPIIVYTGKELTKEENSELQKYAETIIIKGVKSEERLLDETALFLHRTISNLPESKQRMINSLYDKEMIFQSKKILLVDDDMRNIFALSKILKDKGMEIHKAENGRIALECLEKIEGIDLVLMDIMMPEMDGYEAMRKIRAGSKHSHLPVIALTAKAMKEDKQKCIDAGANDYITKPVDVERLLSLMRVWLSK